MATQKQRGDGKQERIVEELDEWRRNRRGGGTLKKDRKIYIAKGSSRKPWVFGQGKYDPSQRALIPRGKMQRYIWSLHLLFCSLFCQVSLSEGHSRFGTALLELREVWMGMEMWSKLSQR